MTWFSKTAAFWSTLILVGFTMEGLSWHGSRTLYNCKKDCKNETDDHLCSRRWHSVDGSANGKPLAIHTWLRNNCELKCHHTGENERVDMDHCTKDGQNITAYLCEEYRGMGKYYKRCMRNETVGLY